MKDIILLPIYCIVRIFDRELNLVVGVETAEKIRQ